MRNIFVPAFHQVRHACALVAIAAQMVILPQNVQAVSAPDVLCTLEQPDGATFQARARGDEFFHWYETEAGYPISFDEVMRS